MFLMFPTHITRVLGVLKQWNEKEWKGMKQLSQSLVEISTSSF